MTSDKVISAGLSNFRGVVYASKLENPFSRRTETDMLGFKNAKEMSIALRMGIYH